jgi:hypothetical protein
MSKWALRWFAHVESKRLKSYGSQAQVSLGHWKFLVGYWTFSYAKASKPRN